MFFWVSGGGGGIKSHIFGIFGSATFYVGGGGGDGCKILITCMA